jgi:hypothetical protein
LDFTIYFKSVFFNRVYWILVKILGLRLRYVIAHYNNIINIDQRFLRCKEFYHTSVNRIIDSNWGKKKKLCNPQYGWPWSVEPLKKEKVETEEEEKKMDAEEEKYAEEKETEK